MNEKPMNTWHFIEQIREANAGCSDYRISQILGITTAGMSHYKAGRQADEEVASRIAAVLKKHTIEVVASIREWQAEAEGKVGLAAAWRNMAAMALGKPVSRSPLTLEQVMAVVPRNVPPRISPIRLQDVVAVTPRTRQGGVVPAMTMADPAMVKSRRAGGGHKKATGITDGFFIFDGSDGRNRTADLGVMNPSL